MNHNLYNQTDPLPVRSLAGQTVLVTGGTGFIGGRLVEKLAIASGVRVRVLVRDFSRASRIARFPIEMVYGGICDYEAVRRAVRGCSVVFHCAHGAGGSAREQWEANVHGARNVAKAVKDEGAQRLVHLSSLAVYGKTPDGTIDENAPRRRWKNPYAESKREAERLLWEQFHKRKLPVVVLQPSIVYGPYGGWSVYPLEWLQTGRIVLIDGGEGLCNCVYVDDVVDALLLAATREGVIGETFLISAETAVTWRDFWGAYERLLGLCSTVSISLSECRRREFRRGITPRSIALAMALARHPRVRAKLADLGLGKITAAVFGKPVDERIHWPDAMQINQGAMRTRLDLRKAKAMLGYRPRFDFDAGMALTEKWARWANLLPGGCFLTQDDLLAADAGIANLQAPGGGESAAG